MFSNPEAVKRGTIYSAMRSWMWYAYPPIDRPCEQ